MIKTNRSRQLAYTAIAALLAGAPLLGANKTIKSTPQVLPTDRLLIPTNANWVDGVAPLAGDDLFFNDMSVGNRLVVHSSSSTTVFSFNSLNLTQVSPFINRLDLRAPLTVATDIVLAASGGGQTVMRVDTANVGNSGTTSLATYAAQTNAANTALTVGNITVNAGGSLIFARNLVSTNNTMPRYLSGNVTVNDGGTFVARRAFRPTPTSGTNTNAATSQNYIIGGSFTLNSGASMSVGMDDLAIVDAPSGAETEMSDTRLQINGDFTANGGSIASENITVADLGLGGATNVIAAGTNLNATDLILTTSVASDQSLTSGVGLNALLLISAGNSVKTVTAPQVGNIAFRQNTAESSVTLRLGGDMALKDAAVINAAPLGAAGTVNQGFIIDTNSFTLNGVAGTISFNNSSSARASDWLVTGGGAVSAGSITFNATTNPVAPDLTVTAGTDLTAGTFDATSVGLITLGVDGPANFASIQGTTQIFAGALAIQLGAAPTVGTYQLFGASGGTGDFSSVAITGAESVALTGPDVWTGSSASYTYTFSESTGTLVIALPGPVLTPLETWRQTHFGTTVGAGDFADSADFDRDGSQNLVEYALGTLPADVTSFALPTVNLSGLRLQISFQRARADVNYLVESSTDFVTWIPVSLNPGNVGETVTVNDLEDVASPAQPRRFLRLNVSVP